jgi:hypothetical protein
MDDTLTHDRSTWQSLLEEITLGRRGQPVTLEIMDEELGDQTPAHRLPLDSIGYDTHDDVIVLGLSGLAPGEGVVLRHLITAPRSLDLLEQPNGCLVLQVVDGAAVQTLVLFTPDTAAQPA